ncbi:MAG TPA: long-chain fatty acid--CoA ligase [Gammaproteobacteria bacterium]|nr:long-chain fatty acid--CoA ligase [Gammaproteobacteria bacterium]
MTQWSKDIIPLESAKTLDGLFRARVLRSPGAVAYINFDKGSGTWLETTWEQMGQQVLRWRAALAQERLQPGDRVAILLRNGRDWVAFDQAALAQGLVVVPLYVEDRPDNAAFILADSAAKLLLLQDLTHWRRLQPALGALTSLQRVVVAADAGKAELDDPRLRHAEDWLNAASEQRYDDLPPHTHDAQQLASIVYTSGTTGRPKGVMLSHHNMLWNAHAVVSLVDVYREDVFFSLLPLSHTLERTANYYMPMLAGATVAYSRSIAQLGEDMLTLRPTVMICVPRVLERVHNKITTQLEKSPWFARALFRLTLNTGWRRFQCSQGRARPTPQLLLWPALQRKVAAQVLAKMGGRLRAAISGGAALPLPVAQFFIGLGLPVLQGYGLTESSPVISVNPPEDNDPASVGVPLPGVEVRVGEHSELLARGPGVMMGYWNNHSATHERVDAEGWLHTGDQARIDNKHIYLTGRIKDILVLSNGEKVPPEDMEMAITQDPLFEQALVVGEGRAHLAALLVLNAEQWAELAVGLNIDPNAPASLNDSRVLSHVLPRVAKQLRDFPGYAKVRRVALLREPWTVENDLLTPTLKVKRNKVTAHYSKLIDALFAEPAASPGRARS